MALALNIVLIFGALAYFDATLTLPGIAGIVLTIGMAVDANVLIFERIREELRHGRTVKSAIDAGFGKALSSVLDANVTTLIAALFLFQFGTGPIRGFAVTLSIGILASLFTAIFVSRWLFDLCCRAAGGSSACRSRPLADPRSLPWSSFATPNIDFMKYRRFFVVGRRSVLLVIGIVAVFVPGKLNLGIDFAGGTQLDLKFARAAGDRRAARRWSPRPGISDAQIQRFGEAEDNEVIDQDADRRGQRGGQPRSSSSRRSTGATTADAAGRFDLNRGGVDGLSDLLLRARPRRARGSDDEAAAGRHYDEVAAAIIERAPRAGADRRAGSRSRRLPESVPATARRRCASSAALGSFAVLGAENVGPQIGAELRQKGILAVVLSLIGMLVYIWFRFELRFGIGALVAVIHDVLIVLGLFALAGYEFNLTTIAAFLTLVGYSVNDTVVVFDRVRENLRRSRRQPLVEVMNVSLNQTLSRTVLTSGTTLLALGCLLVLGGDVLRGFAFILTLGVIVGTYSSIYVASPFALLWENVVRRRGQGAAIGRLGPLGASPATHPKPLHPRWRRPRLPAA